MNYNTIESGGNAPYINLKADDFTLKYGERKTYIENGYGKSYSVFPYNIYQSKTVLPAPYYSYEPRVPFNKLVKPGTDIDPYSQPGSYARYKDSDGNLIGKSCKCMCNDVSLISQKMM